MRMMLPIAVLALTAALHGAETTNEGSSRTFEISLTSVDLKTTLMGMPPMNMSSETYVVFRRTRNGNDLTVVIERQKLHVTLLLINISYTTTSPGKSHQKFVQIQNKK